MQVDTQTLYLHIVESASATLRGGDLESETASDWIPCDFKMFGLS